MSDSKLCHKCKVNPIEITVLEYRLNGENVYREVCYYCERDRWMRFKEEMKK